MVPPIWYGAHLRSSLVRSAGPAPFHGRRARKRRDPNDTRVCAQLLPSISGRETQRRKESERVTDRLVQGEFNCLLSPQLLDFYDKTTFSGELYYIHQEGSDTSAGRYVGLVFAIFYLYRIGWCVRPATGCLLSLTSRRANSHAAPCVDAGEHVLHVRCPLHESGW